jgi:hypothetical protein
MNEYQLIFTSSTGYKTSLSFFMLSSALEVFELQYKAYKKVELRKNNLLLKQYIA